MADRIESLWCSNCGKACHARICGVEGFVGSDCCEGYLLRRVTDSEIDAIYADLDADEPRSAAENARLKIADGV